jgi:hypothetical protein
MPAWSLQPAKYQVRVASWVPFQNQASAAACLAARHIALLLNQLAQYASLPCLQSAQLFGRPYQPACAVLSDHEAHAQVRVVACTVVHAVGRRRGHKQEQYWCSCFCPFLASPHVQGWWGKGCGRERAGGHCPVQNKGATFS